MRPLPNTIRPCRPDGADGPAVEIFVDRVEHVTFPFHHVAACCMVGATAWAGLFAASRLAMNVVAQLV